MKPKIIKNNIDLFNKKIDTDAFECQKGSSPSTRVGNFANLHIEYKSEHFVFVYDSEEPGKIAIFATSCHSQFEDCPVDVNSVGPMRHYFFDEMMAANPSYIEELITKLCERLHVAYEI